MAQTTAVGAFSRASLNGWEQHGFHGRTAYHLEKEHGVTIVKASSHHAASALFHRVRIDLSKTPWLNWRWRINHILPTQNERQKSGDDFPVRIYIIASGGIFFWNTKAINYVWSSHEPAGSHWPSPYTFNSVMMAVESGSGHARRWQSYKRNVREDFRRLFGRDIGHIEAVAIMTDTDSTKSDALASYGDIYFSSQ